MIYRGFPGKLYHDVPHWVDLGALFHIRIEVDRQKQKAELTAVPLAQALLDSARLYEEKQVLAYHAVPINARPFARGFVIPERQDNESHRWRLETLSNARTRDRLAARLLRSSITK